MLDYIENKVQIIYGLGFLLGLSGLAANLIMAGDVVLIPHFINGGLMGFCGVGYLFSKYRQQKNRERQSRKNNHPK